MGYEDAGRRDGSGMLRTPFALSAEQQAIASKAVDTRVIVEAGPGTGKTETVAHRLVYLLSIGVRPSQLLVLSFSRNAVRTLLGRIACMQSDAAESSEELRYLSVRTFDSWTFRTLRQLNHSPTELLRGSHEDNIELLISELRGPQRGAAASLLANIQHIVVDEFQDLAGVRGSLVLEVLDLLAPPDQPRVGFTVLGDPAQAIYAFALRSGPTGHADLTSGALLSTIRKSYGSAVATLTLDHNHRATEHLGSLAANLRRLLLRRTKGATKLNAMREIMARIRVTEDGLVPGSLMSGEIRNAAVLTATNGDAIRVARKLLSSDAHAAVPVILHSGSQPRFVPPWIGALLGPLQSPTLSHSRFQKIYEFQYGGKGQAKAAALNVPAAEAAWQRLVKACDAGSGATSIDIGVLRARLHWVDLLPDDEGAVSSGIHVMTIHQSKGMEFDVVAVMPEGLLDRKFETDPEEAEAASVLFVGVTRAAKTLLRAEERHTYGPMYLRQNDGRSRWFSWSYGWVNLEMGAPGDIDALSFVDRRVFSEDGSLASEVLVKETQEYLAMHAADLRGQKVMLCLWKVPGNHKSHYRYRIHLQDGDAPGRILGVTTDSVTYDLLNLLHEKGYWLPKHIFNLRITDVVTMGLRTEAAASLALPYARSGFWLGVNIYGTGDFKPFKGSTPGGAKKSKGKYGRKRSTAAH